MMPNQVPAEAVEALYQIANGDYAGVFGRLQTNERIAKFVTMFADDASYANLTSNMEQGNWDEAFRAAHTLKGTARDMGFIELSDAASEVTEALRANNITLAKELMPAVEDSYHLVSESIAMFRS
jgi:HPt (histidine-containing phosphotransfer) domain-containing protein